MRTFPSRGPVVSRIDLLKMTGSELRSLPRIPPLAGLKAPKASRAGSLLLTTVRSSMNGVPIPPPDQAPVARLRIVEAKRAWIDRVIGLVVLAMFTVGGVAVATVTWSLIPNHAVALGAIVVVVPSALSPRGVHLSLGRWAST
jgi:hypothetical protein